MVGDPGIKVDVMPTRSVRALQRDILAHQNTLALEAKQRILDYVVEQIESGKLVAGALIPTTVDGRRHPNVDLNHLSLAQLEAVCVACTQSLP